MIVFQLLPDAARAEPHSPPINAWLELEGSPNHQVSKFHRMALNNAQMMMSEVIETSFASTRPEEMVLATAVPQRAPSRFVHAASITAWRGVSTFVETTVAIELAVSWKPLMYSKTSATKMTTKTRSMRWSGIFQGDLSNDIAGIAAAVDNFFEQFVEVLQDDDLECLVFAPKQISVKHHHVLVGFAFEKLQLVVQLFDLLQVHAVAERLHQLQHDIGR